MNFSSIFFLNLVSLQLSVIKERMLLHFIDLILLDLRFFLFLEICQFFMFASHIVTLLTVLISQY